MVRKDEIALHVGSKAVSGWTEVNVTHSIQQIPNVWQASFTEVSPDEVRLLQLNPGDYAELYCGSTLMVAGYVDIVQNEVSAGAHAVRMMGRGKCMDLIDASAEWPNGQFANCTVLDLAKNLVKPFGTNTETGESHPILVHCDIADLVRVPQLNLILSESAHDILDRVARYSGVMLYEDRFGDLVIGRAGSTKMATPLMQGINIQSARVRRSADQRFDKYTAFISSIWPALDGGDGGNLIGGTYDVGVKRHRPRHIIAEAVTGFQDIAMRRAIWEMNRRIGMSEVVSLTVDTWFDEKGTLWTANSLVDILIPSLGIRTVKTLLIVSVTFVKNAERGTVADMTLMDASAYSIQPVALYQSRLIDTSTITN
ncbi:phage baseplate assembly protein [Herbaspirillum huttiense]|uniref:phage baseplate assembly protein n=1 Tax=Herbaspirillum huttiense TaxID=863372 RepID=UPI00040864F1|nr:hypothetical protein [Herbaspirillum huttiense]